MEVSATCDSSSVSSRKLHAGTKRGVLGNASDTRLCLRGVDGLEDEEAGNGALNENVEVDGTLVCSATPGCAAIFRTVYLCDVL